MKFSENLRSLRKEKDYSQEYLAEVMGVSRQTVSKWENGTAMPDLKKLTELAEFFGTTMDNLLGIEGADDKSDDENKIDVNHYNYYIQQLEARYDELVERKNKEYINKKKWVNLLEDIIVICVCISLLITVHSMRSRIDNLEEQVDYLQSEQEYQEQSKVNEIDFVEHKILSVNKEKPYLVTVRCTYAPEEYTNGTKVYFTKTVGKKTDKYEAKTIDGKYVAEFPVNLTESSFYSLIINNGIATKNVALDSDFDVPFINDYLSVSANCYYAAMFESRDSAVPYALEFCDNNAGQNICFSSEFCGKIKSARLVVKDYFKNKSGKEVYLKELEIKKNTTDYTGDTQIVLPKRLELTDFSDVSSMGIYVFLTGEDSTVYSIMFGCYGDETSDETTFDLSGEESGYMAIHFPDGTTVGEG
ncbi:MAG: helix-turn-helix transcriptional regulator [Eubacterium sp.]|nr:helix-turn-helix transcriptional regulator [Eubacterium sp.]